MEYFKSSETSLQYLGDSHVMKGLYKTENGREAKIASWVTKVGDEWRLIQTSFMLPSYIPIIVWNGKSQ